MGLVLAYFVTTFGPVALTLVASIAACSLVILLLVTMIGQVSTSTMSGRAKAEWIVLAVLLPVISTALWYFFGPRPEATDEELESAEALFDEFVDAG